MRPGALSRRLILSLAALGVLAGCGRTPEDEARKKQGVDYASRRLYKEAVAEFDGAISLRPDKPRAYYMRGIAYVKMGEPGKALPDFKKACSMSDRDACTMASRLQSR